MKKLKTLICILFSVLLISGMFTSCNGDATSSLVNNSVTTVISMSVDKSIAQELSDSSKLNWFIMGTKPGSDENDKLLEVVEPFSADNPSFSKEIEVTADTPVVFGLCADDEWLKANESMGIPVQWRITGHKINESGTEVCKVEQYTKKVTLRKMELDSNTLRMTDVEKGTETKDDLSYCILAPIAKIIGYSSVKDFTEDTSRSVAEEEIIEVPYRFLTGGEALVNKLSGGSVSLSDTENVDRFGQVKWENLVIVGTEDTDTEEEIVAKAKEGKLLVVPGNMIKQTIKLISPDEDEDDDIDVWVPYSAQDIEAEYQDNLFFFFAIDKKGNTYFSYSDFSKWCDGIWKDGLSDDKFKQAVIVDFQDEIDSYSEFKNSVQTGGATSRAADDPIKELEKALSGITYRYKIYHANYNYPAYKLFLSSVSTADKELLAKYEWTYIKNDSGKIADLVKGKSGDYNYGKLNVSTRTIRLWCIHNTKDHTHMYLIKDQPDMNFSNTYIGTGDGNSAIEQIISNTGGDWSYYGGSWSGYTVAKGKEWYGDSAWIQTRVVRKDGSPLSGSIAFSNTSPATTTVTHKISKGFSIHLDAGIGVEIGKESKIKPELKGGFSFSDSVSYDVPEVSVFYKSDPTYVRWEYNIRDDWDCSFSPFRYAGSKVKSQPSNTSVSNLRPNESIYMITVVDSVVKNARLELKCGSKLKRKAFKAGVSCCIGYTSAEATAYADLPYDKDPSNYEGGKFPWKE